MNIFHLEEERINLLKLCNSEYTPLHQIINLNKFFKKVLETNDKNTIDVFSHEFLPYYSNTLNHLNVIGINPKFVRPIISTTNDIIQKIVPKSDNRNFERLLDKIDQSINTILASLEGINKSLKGQSLTFPVSLKKNNGEIYYGQIESFEVKIHKDSSLTKNKFLIVPSSESIEKMFEEQLEISWEIAIDFLRKYHKGPNKFHEIVLVFNHKYANIEGYSLGVAITLGFIQALFEFYNTSLNLNLTGNVTFTGGFDKNKRIKSIGSDIIGQKVETVFYSPYNYFALPDADLIPAKNKLTDLQIIYPKRELKIISLQDFDDLINHRQIVNLEKAKILERGKKFALNNKIIILLSSIILLSLFALSVYITDNNPTGFKIVNKNVHIVNKHGKILWSTKQSFDKGLDIIMDPPYVHRIFDIDNDGINEVLLAHELTSILDSTKSRKISCYDKSGEIIWQYLFEDTVSTILESFQTKQYYSAMLDIVKDGDKNVLLAISRHLYFPSAIYKLDIKTGERLPGTLWSQGHFRRGITADVNNDGVAEIFIGGINNGYETAFVTYLSYDQINGQTPSTPDYLFKNIPLAKIDHYFHINKSDICNFLGQRYNRVVTTYYDVVLRDYLVNTHEGSLKLPIGVVYRFDQDFNTVSTQIGDDLQYVRDSLVHQGRIVGPLTNDPEYSKQLLDGIRKWNGKRFINFP